MVLKTRWGSLPLRASSTEQEETFAATFLDELVIGFSRAELPAFWTNFDPVYL